MTYESFKRGEFHGALADDQDKRGESHDA